VIQPKYVTLTGLFADRVFRIPSYQRFYSWQEKQREDLFNDIRVLSRISGDGHHFMATIVCHDTGEKASVGATDYHVFEVVDGQQRITTLIILLRAVAKKLETGADKQEVEQLLVKRDGNLLLLQTNNANQTLFNEYLRTGSVPQTDEVKTHADRNLQQGIIQSERFVEDWIGTGKGFLDLLRLIKNRLGFVVYDTEDKRSVYTVFEVLNSRGLDVDWLDKCKSVLMGRAFETAPTEPARVAAIQELEAKWGNIYNRLAVFPVPGHEVLRATASTRCETDAGKPLSAEASLAAFKLLCDTPTATQEVTNWIHKTADALVKLEEQRHLGPVADVLHARVLAVAIMLAEQLSNEEKSCCLDQWERVTFRIFGLLRKDSRTKVGDYIRLARRIVRQEQGAKTYVEIFSELKNLGARYPIEGAVQEGLVKRNCYEGFETECRYLLWRYEESLAQKVGAEVNKELRAAIWEARSAAETIEHIFPQNPEVGGPWDGKLNSGETPERQIHRVGNLLLLPKALNSEATRKSFANKKSAYAKSEGLRIVKEVTEKADWTQAEIEEREARIVEWAKTAWGDLP
jgi:hypothetical protein